MAKRLRILHLSDLHVGKERPEDGWRVERVMGDAWARNLREIAADGPIDLVCFTGDLAQKGKPDEYVGVREVIDAVLESVGCSRERFFCVPGNHDIDRGIAPDAWSKLRELQAHDPQGLSRWMAGGHPPFGCEPEWRDGIVQRQQAYRGFLTTAGLPHLLPEHGPHGRLGYRCTLDLGLGAPLHIVGFDSAWLAGDDHDAGKLRLTDDQIGRLMTGADGKALPGWSIGLIHHPLTDLADVRDAQRLLGHYGLGLLLHGHQHDPLVERRADPQTVLQIFAAGCLYEHQRYPNGLLVVDVELPEAHLLRPKQVWARKWSHRRSEWIDDDELYRGTRNGRLQLAPEPITPFTPTPGTFVGRDDERNALCAALLPAARGEDTRPTVICCAIDGMPGVGKTRLAEEFVGDDWREALGLPKCTPQQDFCARLALGQDDRRTVADLAAAVLVGYQLNVPLDFAAAELRKLLLSGPGGQRLLLIENVDGPAQAKVVAMLVTQLSGCAVLATARYRDLAGASWERIPVAPLSLAPAIALLRNRSALGRKPHPLKDDEAADLVQRLGYLPLALHIAGSHLGRGLSPQRFREQLETHRLALGPAAASDAVNNSDAARSVIASAFSISWDIWCRLADVDWQAALAALGHGPVAGVGDALGAVITDLSRTAYEDCTLEADSLSLLEVEFVEQYGETLRRVRIHPLIAEFLRNYGGVDDEVVAIRLLNWCNLEFGMGPERPTKNPAWVFLRFETPEVLRWLARSLRLVNDRHEKNYSSAELHEKIADILQYQGEYEESLKMYREEVLPIYKKLGDIYSSATTHGQIAGILQSRGELEEALRIRREDELPVYERLGDVRSGAVTQGKIAGILQSRGELEEALRIRREDELPVYERLGDVRLRAITQGQIADILQSRGELEEALRIRREEQMPVYERLGDVRSLLVGRANLAMTLAQRGWPEDRPEILTLLEQAQADAELLRLPEAETIRGLIAQIFGGNDDGAATL